jgi:hypothetical protein
LSYTVDCTVPDICDGRARRISRHAIKRAKQEKIEAGGYEHGRHNVAQSLAKVVDLDDLPRWIVAQPESVEHTLTVQVIDGAQGLFNRSCLVNSVQVEYIELAHTEQGHRLSGLAFYFNVTQRVHGMCFAGDCKGTRDLGWEPTKYLAVPLLGLPLPVGSAN